jgi:hypothetical protein
LEPVLFCTSMLSVDAVAEARAAELRRSPGAASAAAVVVRNFLRGSMG